jgi:hypothetical protein
MAKFTSGHYTEIAKILRETKPTVIKYPDVVERAERLAQWEIMVTEFRHWFSITNPLFSSTRFLLAVGWTGTPDDQNY